MSESATCIQNAGYADALSLGSSYELLERNPDNSQVRLLGDNGRTRWFPASCFALDGREALLLQSWEFEHTDFDPLTGNVDVHLTFTGDVRRWSLLATPANLAALLAESGADPVFQAAHLVVVSALSRESVEAALRFLEQEGRLLESSLPF